MAQQPAFIDGLIRGRLHGWIHCVTTHISWPMPRIAEFPFLILFHMRTAWLVTSSDMASVLVPQGIAAMANVLSGWVASTSPENHATLRLVAHRVPHMILWIWLNLFTLGLANQRLDRSIQEDHVNKSWRPIPANRLTAADAQTVLSVAVPATLGASIFLGGVQESLWMASLNWIYNDLGAANGHFAVRNFFNALGLSLFSVGATRVLQGSEATISPAGSLWTAVMGCCIFTTLSLQDLYDLEGDLARGRRTAPMVLGPMCTRVVTAVMVLGWSVIVPAYLQGSGYVHSITLALGHFIAIRTIRLRSVEDDKITFKAWCLWMTVMYALPLLSRPCKSCWETAPCIYHV